MNQEFQTLLVSKQNILTFTVELNFKWPIDYLITSVFLKLTECDIIALCLMLVNRVESQMKPKTHRMPYYYELISKVKQS